MRCCYCLQLINIDDDAQRVDKDKYAHTLCAFAVDEALFAALDDENLLDESNKDDE